MITFQQESFNTIRDECFELAKNHYEEIASDKDIVKLNPWYYGFEELEKAGAMKIITAKDNGKLIGYAFFLVQRSLHYYDFIVAVADLYYVDPKYRHNNVGTDLLNKSEEILKDLGVHQIYMRTKVYADFSPLLEKNGYNKIEVAYKKNINIPK